MVEVEPTSLEFDDDNFSVEYESFSCGSNINECLDADFYVEFESFSFDPIIRDPYLGLTSLNF